MAYAVIAIEVAAAIAAAYSAYRTSETAQESAKYNQKVSDQNAQIASMEAKSVAAQGQVQEDAYRRKLAGLMGSQRASEAASGVDINTGSALTLQEDTAELGTQDVDQLRRQTAQSVWQTKLQGLSSSNQATLYGYQADQTSPALAGGTAFLQGSASVASSWYQYNKPAADGYRGTSGQMVRGPYGMAGGGV